MKLLQRSCWALVAALLVTACVQQETTAYVRPSNSAVEHAYVKQGADFSQYDKLKLEGLGIYYPNSESAPENEDLLRIREIFTEAFSRELVGAYPIVDEAGPDVLSVQAQIIDMKISGADSDYEASGRLRDLVARGELTFLMQLSDSETGEVLARAGDKTTDITSPDNSADWTEVKHAAEHWAGMFRNWLDQSLGTPGQD